MPTRRCDPSTPPRFRWPAAAPPAGWRIPGAAALATAGLLATAPTAVAQPLELTLVITNTSQRTLVALQAAPSGGAAAVGGGNLIEGQVIRPGLTHRIRLPVETTCSFDLRATYDNGQREERRAYDICRQTRIAFGAGAASPLPDKPPGTAGGGAAGGAAVPAPLAPGQPAPTAPAVADPSFNLANRGPRTINELYVSPVASRAWGSDLLGAEVLAPGQVFPVRLPSDGNCLYDVRVVYDDGRSQERRRVNTCTLSTLGFP